MAQTRRCATTSENLPRSARFVWRPTHLSCRSFEQAPRVRRSVYSKTPNTSSNPALWTRETDEQRAELLERERRTLFVAMTRAMRALMVALPEGRELPLFTGFEPKYWNTGERA
mgnify:CR=1 FL=1